MMHIETMSIEMIIAGKVQHPGVWGRSYHHGDWSPGVSRDVITFVLVLGVTTSRELVQQTYSKFSAKPSGKLSSAQLVS